MQFGLTMFITDYSISAMQLAKEAEDRGFDSIWLPEHTHIPASRKTPYPAGGDLPKEYWHTLDPFGALCAAAAVTRTIKLATGICLVIERDTIVTAKEVATVDHISNGRFIFGIGGGWNVEEMGHHGTRFKTRFAKLREQILAMRAIWTQEEAEFHGEFVDFEPLWSYPKPVQAGGPPVVLGGATTYTLDRVVDYCDGWLPIAGRIPPQVMAKRIADLHARAQKKGRDPKSISISIFGAPQRPEALDAYRAMGVERLVFMLRPEPADLTLPKLDRLAALVGRSQP